MNKRIILILSFVITENIFGSDRKYYFFNPDLKHGPESTFNPINRCIISDYSFWN